MGIITALLVFAIFLVFLLQFYKNYKDRHHNFPPGPPRLPIYGSYWYLLKENYNLTHVAIEKLSKKYKTNLLGFYLGKDPTVVSVSYEMTKEVLTREEFNGKNDTFITRCRSFGEIFGLFPLEGPKWQEQRRFSLHYLRDFGLGRRLPENEAFIESETRDLVHFLTNNPSKRDMDVCREKGKVLFPDIFYGPVLNIVLHLLIRQKFENRELRKISHGILRLLQSGDQTGNALSITPWLRFIAPNFFGYSPIREENKRLFDFFQKIVDERNSHFSDGNSSDFLDVYLSKLKSVENIKETSFSDKQMIWLLIDLMFPAPITVPPTLTYIFAYLIIYPEIQRKVRAEIHRVVGTSRLPNLNDRQSMPFTEAFIKEVLRIQPVQTISSPRRCVKDTVLGGYNIPKDTFVLPCQWTSNHDPNIWEEPYTFKPERFIDQKGNLLKKDNTFVFGGGKRVCVAETFARHLLFLLTAGLLQHFTFREVDKLPEIENKKSGVVVCMADFWAEAILN